MGSHVVYELEGLEDMPWADYRRDLYSDDKVSVAVEALVTIQCWGVLGTSLQTCYPKL